MDDQNAVFSDPPAGQMHETSADVIGQCGGLGYIKPDLYGRGDLVDVLAARAGCADEILLNFTRIN